MSIKSVRSLIAGLLLSALPSLAGADGRIIQMDFCGPDDPTHPNVVQITIEGGFNTTGCDLTFAAIRSDPSRQHLISFALSSYLNGQSVKVLLNPADKYFPSPNAANGRCAISRISNH